MNNWAKLVKKFLSKLDPSRLRNALQVTITVGTYVIIISVTLFAFNTFSNMAVW